MTPDPTHADESPSGAALQQFHREIQSVIDHLPQEHVVHVREGGGPENLAATLALSCARLSAAYLAAQTRITQLEDHP